MCAFAYWYFRPLVYVIYIILTSITKHVYIVAFENFIKKNLSFIIPDLTTIKGVYRSLKTPWCPGNPLENCKIILEFLKIYICTVLYWCMYVCVHIDIMRYSDCFYYFRAILYHLIYYYERSNHPQFIQLPWDVDRY